MKQPRHCAAALPLSFESRSCSSQKLGGTLIAAADVYQVRAQIDGALPEEEAPIITSPMDFADLNSPDGSMMTLLTNFERPAGSAMFRAWRRL